MAKYHQDENMRVRGERHAAIVMKDGKLLTVHRIKDGYEYWVFPGGHRRNDETGEQAVIRETLEETGITVKNPRLEITFPDKLEPNTNYYYICDWEFGDNPHLTGEELAADPTIDFFDPVWVDLKEVERLNLLPLFAKNWLQEYLKHKNVYKNKF